MLLTNLTQNESGVETLLQRGGMLSISNTRLDRYQLFENGK